MSRSPQGDQSNRIVTSRPDHRNFTSLQHAYRNPSVLLVPGRWIEEMRTAKDQLGVQEVQAMLLGIGESFALVPLEPHAVM
jgi:hypothetical protein